MTEPRRELIGGRYEVLTTLGRGGMGVVYKAHDPVLERDVAIKQMATSIVDSDEHRRRFQIEARAAARLNHPNIVTIYELEEHHGDVYIVMELLEGLSLGSLLQRRTPPPLDVQLAILAQVCDGLDFAHARAIVHRDIKPANLILLPSGIVKILDFGIALLAASELTRQGAVLGTPNYMAPEQVNGEQVDSRADLFSVGAVAYELVAGVKAFSADSIPALLMKIAEASYRPLSQIAPETPPALEALVARLLSKRREDRPVRGCDVRAALEAIGPIDRLDKVADAVAAAMDPAEGDTIVQLGPRDRSVTPVASRSVVSPHRAQTPPRIGAEPGIPSLIRSSAPLPGAVLGGGGHGSITQNLGPREGNAAGTGAAGAPPALPSEAITPVTPVAPASDVITPRALSDATPVTPPRAGSDIGRAVPPVAAAAPGAAGDAPPPLPLPPPLPPGLMPPLPSADASIPSPPVPLTPIASPPVPLMAAPLTAAPQASGAPAAAAQTGAADGSGGTSGTTGTKVTSGAPLPSVGAQPASTGSIASTGAIASTSSVMPAPDAPGALVASPPAGAVARVPGAAVPTARRASKATAVFVLGLAAALFGIAIGASYMWWQRLRSEIKPYVTTPSQSGNSASGAPATGSAPGQTGSEAPAAQNQASTAQTGAPEAGGGQPGNAASDAATAATSDGKPGEAGAPVEASQPTTASAGAADASSSGASSPSSAARTGGAADAGGGGSATVAPGSGGAAPSGAASESSAARGTASTASNAGGRAASAGVPGAAADRSSATSASGAAAARVSPRQPADDARVLRGEPAPPVDSRQPPPPANAASDVAPPAGTAAARAARAATQPRTDVDAETVSAFQRSGDATAVLGSERTMAAAAVVRIRDTVERYAKAIEERDLDTLRGLREPISPAEQKLLNGPASTVRFSDIDVDVAGTDATAHARRLIVIAGQPGTTETVTLHLTRRPSGWVITSITR